MSQILCGDLPSRLPNAVRDCLPARYTHQGVNKKERR